MLNRVPEDAVYTQMQSPIGELTLIACDKGLRAILWEDELQDEQCSLKLESLRSSPRHPICLKAKKQLKEYFTKKRTKFDIPLVMDGTDFQKQAWKSLTKIPHGKLISYQQQALSLGDAKKSRAVGTANSKNPIPIIVPCHRVIAKSGKLSGFAGGLNIKKHLIDLENH